MKRRLRTVSITAAALSAAIVMSACGSDSNDTATKPAETTSAAAVAAEPSKASAAVALNVAKDATLGDIVTDSSGFTLYRFDKDTAKPPTSNCSGGCATAWPPVLASGKPELKGIDAALVGTVKRADNTEQLTINGWPLYRFAGDTDAGQTNGQNSGGVWWVVTPKGAKAGDAAAKPAAEPASAPPEVETEASYSSSYGY